MTPWSLARDVPPLKGARVTVMGLGMFGGGVGAARFLAARGARVLVTDLRPEEALRESIESLNPYHVELRLGGHQNEYFSGADWVLVNPAVPPDSPWLKRARAIDTEMNLFLKLCRARAVVGITGSNGKTTTTALIGEVLRRGPRRTWVGGNIGGSLLERVDEIGSDDLVVLELSSFQLEHADAIERSPRVAVVMNLTPNHLDRHGTMERYAAAKRAIVAHQGPDDWKVLNADDPVVSGFRAPSRTATFSLRGDADVRAAGERIEWRLPGGSGALDVSTRRLPGTFNLQNMAAATAASRLAFPEWEGWEAAVRDALIAFPGVEHRLEFVVERGGVKYYNDSIATNPDSTLAALDTLPGPFVLIAGGYDKKLPFEALGRRIAEKVRAAVLLGQTADAIAAAIGPGATQILRGRSFDEAVALAVQAARKGDTVLLSPACASFDMFRNFAERGRRFKELVQSTEPGRTL
ncbi:MAG: UDP-N-acetylmuramoyl-L-alanine--D-glutamate ligase [Planctomycetes bacterium]|nr:UDP-N-acetylmuramoyl-L-alanine--D-glutamate ligase [Planctomycetota bacterium]